MDEKDSGTKTLRAIDWQMIRISLWFTIALIFAVANLFTIGCAGDPKPRATLNAEGVRKEGPSNSAAALTPSGQATVNGSTPTGSAQVFSGGETVALTAQPSPIDLMLFEALGINFGLTNTVEVDSWEFGFAVGADGESTIQTFKGAGFRTKPRETIEALAGFQTAWNPFAQNADNATKEAWNEQVRATAATVQATFPALAEAVMKLLVPVP